jgi:hypothetical protein
MLEVPGHVEGTTELVIVPIEVFAMLLMQGGVQVEAQPQEPEQPLAPARRSEPRAIGI